MNDHEADAARVAEIRERQERLSAEPPHTYKTSQHRALLIEKLLGDVAWLLADRERQAEENEGLRKALADCHAAMERVTAEVRIPGPPGAEQISQGAFAAVVEALNQQRDLGIPTPGKTALDTFRKRRDVQAGNAAAETGEPE